MGITNLTIPYKAFNYILYGIWGPCS